MKKIGDKLAEAIKIYTKDGKKKFTIGLDNIVFPELVADKYTALVTFFDLLMLRPEQAKIWDRVYRDNHAYKFKLRDFITSYISPFSSSLLFDFTQIAERLLFYDEKHAIVIWPSNKIKYAYLEQNYATNTGHLGNSCMRKKEMQKALNFYEINNVKIAVIADKKNKILARALLWDGVYVKGKKVTYLDRVYYSRGYQLQDYYKFARENNILTIPPKKKVGEFVDYYRNLPPMYVKNISVKGITHLPWTDTFRFLFYKDGVATNESSCLPMGLLRPDVYLKLSVLGDTSNDYGYFRQLDPNSVKEAISGMYISKKDAIYIEKYKGHVRHNKIVVVNGQYYSKDDHKNIGALSNGDFILRERIVIELFTGCYIDKNKAVTIEDKERNKGYVLKENVFEFYKKTYSIYDTANIIQYKNKYYHKNQCCLCCASEQFIPKEYVYAVYDLDNEGNFSKKYYITIELTNQYKFLATGEALLSTVWKEKRGSLVYYNKKYYLKKDFIPKDKKQLLLFGKL